MSSAPSIEEQGLIAEVYRDFNARRIDAVLARMDPNVDWPNGMEGGRVYGHEGVRAYWTRQWSLIDPHVEPIAVTKDEAGRVTVQVHQVVKDLKGNLLADTVVLHAYTVQDGRILKMDIE